MTTDPKSIRQREDLAVKIVDGGLLILDKKSEKIHQLNETAGFVWTCLAEGQETPDIASEIAKNFDVDPKVAAKDIAEIVAQFEALGLLRTNASE